MTSKSLCLVLASVAMLAPALVFHAETPETFQPEVFKLEGRVFLGDQPRAAKLEFLLGEGGKLAVSSDAAGHYEVQTSDVLRKVEIELVGREGIPFHEFFTKDVRRDGVRDFHLPGTELKVKVVDAETGQAIPAATLMVRNSFPARDKEGLPVPPRHAGEEAPTAALMQSAEADPSGVATLYYLFPGQVELAGKAEGYTKSPERMHLQLKENEHLETVLRLQPLGRKAGLLIKLPGGGKASGAAVLLLESLEPFKAIAAATADAEGRALLPLKLAGSLMTIRHEGAAFLIGKWQPAEANKDAEIELAPAAEVPLKAVARTGQERLPFGELVLWVDGRRLSGQLLFQLTGVAPMTNGEGEWSASSLPRSAAKVLIFSRQDPGKAAAARSGQLDAEAVEIPYPWPAEVAVKGLD